MNQSKDSVFENLWPQQFPNIIHHIRFNKDSKTRISIIKRTPYAAWH